MTFDLTCVPYVSTQQIRRTLSISHSSQQSSSEFTITDTMESSSPLEAVQENAEEGVSSKSSVQKSLVYNRHLPYYSRLPDEASLLLEEIKVNLSAAVQKWELWPGALYWTNRLSRCVLSRKRRGGISTSLVLGTILCFVSTLSHPSLTGPYTTRSHGFIS